MQNDQARTFDTAAIAAGHGVGGGDGAGHGVGGGDGAGHGVGGGDGAGYDGDGGPRLPAPLPGQPVISQQAAFRDAYNHAMTGAMGAMTEEDIQAMPLSLSPPTSERRPPWRPVTVGLDDPLGIDVLRGGKRQRVATSIGTSLHDGLGGDGRVRAGQGAVLDGGGLGGGFVGGVHGGLGIGGGGGDGRRGPSGLSRLSGGALGVGAGLGGGLGSGRVGGFDGCGAPYPAYTQGTMSSRLGGVAGRGGGVPEYYTHCPGIYASPFVVEGSTDEEILDRTYGSEQFDDGTYLHLGRRQVQSLQMVNPHDAMGVGATQPPQQTAPFRVGLPPAPAATDAPSTRCAKTWSRRYYYYEKMYTPPRAAPPLNLPCASGLNPPRASPLLMHSALLTLAQSGIAHRMHLVNAKLKVYI
jgi:hypothetical protein